MFFLEFDMQEGPCPPALIFWALGGFDAAVAIAPRKLSHNLFREYKASFEGRSLVCCLTVDFELAPSGWGAVNPRYKLDVSGNSVSLATLPTKQKSASAPCTPCSVIKSRWTPGRSFHFLDLENTAKVRTFRLFFERQPRFPPNKVHSNRENSRF